MTPEPQLASALAVIVCVGWTMLFAGTRKRRLTFRHDRRRCPSCGRVITGRVCDQH